MGTGQMMLVLLSVILFTTLMHSALNNLIIQSEIIFKNMLLLQAEKISDKYINMIDMQMKSGAKTFGMINTEYANLDTLYTTSYTDFHIQINSNYCDLNGITVGGVTMYQRIDLRIDFEFGGDTLNVGTAASPISAVFADPGL